MNILAGPPASPFAASSCLRPQRDERRHRWGPGIAGSRLASAGTPGRWEIGKREGELGGSNGP